MEGLGSFGGDTFNSVQTTLNQYLELMQYIELCHTLGNLGVVPAGYNGYCGSQSFIKDYADLSPDNLKYSRDGRNFLGENDKIRKRNFRKYINTLFLWDYADKNYDAVPLCEAYSKKMELLKEQNAGPDAEYVLPDKEEIDNLCRNINSRIIRRSIFMTAMPSKEEGTKDKFFLGDYIDEGFDGFHCLNLIRDLQNKFTGE